MIIQGNCKKKGNFQRALIIVPPNITYQNFRHPTKNTKAWLHKSGEELGVIITDLPLGALTICGWLNANYEIESKLLDFNVEIHKNWDHPNDQSFEPWFRETLFNLDFEPDLIGFSSLFVTGYNNLLLLGKICRELHPNSKIIVGGNLATTMYSEILEDDTGDCFDALCYGEGELPMKELMEAHDVNEFIAMNPSWITRDKVKNGSFFAHNFINDLDEIPSLDYDLITIQDYQKSPTIKAYTQIEDKTNYITYMTSRGCPFLCTFCSAHTVHGRKMRYFSIERIRDELTSLQQQHNSKTLVLEDDHFLSDTERAKAIIRLARELGMNCVFPNALALFGLKRDMLEELASVGVRQLTLAVESGSPRVLKDLMKKPLKTEITERVAADCYELGMYTDCNIIIGMPGETVEDINVAREFLKKLPANWYRINVATPLAGSEMFETALKRGEMVGDVREAGYKSCVIETEHFTPQEINEVSYALNLELNFVHNTDMQRGNFRRASESFDNVLHLKQDHAFALYFKSKCLIELGETEEADKLLLKAVSLFRHDDVWNFYFHNFGINVVDFEIEYTSQHLEETKNILFSSTASGIGRKMVQLS